MTSQSQSLTSGDAGMKAATVPIERAMPAHAQHSPLFSHSQWMQEDKAGS